MGHYHEYDPSSWNERRYADSFPYNATVAVKRGALMATGVGDARDAASAVKQACADAAKRWRALLRKRKGRPALGGAVMVEGRVFTDETFRHTGAPTRLINSTLTLPPTGASANSVGEFTPQLTALLYDLAWRVR